MPLLFLPHYFLKACNMITTRMVLCPRCNKNLSTNQALTYHLNRRTPCNSIRCCYCEQQFATKLDLQMHLMRCSSVSENEPSDSLLLTIFKASPLGIVATVDDRIRYRSDSVDFLHIDEPFAKYDRRWRIWTTIKTDQYHIHYLHLKNEPCSRYSSPLCDTNRG